ncbi:SirB2 family protein [Vibrio ezurae]|uniref:SirB protein n=1 Tax=Vibrio ezurae NBRC 102218 TaxID=1219080 RepID=U3CQ32_9VIBR|nr:SirB2 family protein [Vibrio ezurae]GAD80293.1 SirB protein [Vibrio ezurae NBRC 102218]
MYVALKNIHLILIALSAGLFITQYILMVTQSPLQNKKFIKITPHAVNGLLILSGILLLLVTGWVPFRPGSEWLTEKFTCVLAYIALGVFALKLGKNQLLRGFAFLGALGWLLMAAKIGMTKMPILMG